MEDEDLVDVWGWGDDINNDVFMVIVIVIKFELGIRELVLKEIYSILLML